MIQNLIVALSNFPAIFPLYQTIKKNDYLTFGVISFVTTGSFLSHLVENHKHGMPGIGFSKEVSYLLNRMDVLGCLLVGCRFGYLYFDKYGFDYNLIIKAKFFSGLVIMSFLMLQISEYDKYNPRLRNRYIVTHSIWYIGIFTTMNYLLKRFIYQ